MAIYLFMGDGDPSLDAGYLAERIGRCCELIGDLHTARWWYGRAVEENPGIARYQEAPQRLRDISIADLFTAEDWQRAHRDQRDQISPREPDQIILKVTREPRFWLVRAGHK